MFKPNQHDRNQIADLLLTDPTSGEACYIVSPLENEEGHKLTFDVASSDNRYKITISIEEV